MVQRSSSSKADEDADMAGKWLEGNEEAEAVHKETRLGQGDEDPKSLGHGD